MPTTTTSRTAAFGRISVQLEGRPAPALEDPAAAAFPAWAVETSRNLPAGKLLQRFRLDVNGGWIATNSPYFYGNGAAPEPADAWDVLESVLLDLRSVRDHLPAGPSPEDAGVALVGFLEEFGALTIDRGPFGGTQTPAEHRAQVRGAIAGYFTMRARWELAAERLEELGALVNVAGEESVSLVRAVAEPGTHEDPSGGIGEPWILERLQELSKYDRRELDEVRETLRELERAGVLSGRYVGGVSGHLWYPAL